MKKLLSVLLTLSMLLTILIVPISAGGTEPTVGATLTEDMTSGRKLVKGTDTTFEGATVIYELADFAGITSGNYILANDIEVGTVTGSLVIATDDFILDGNGYSFNGINFSETTGLFVPCDGKTTTIKNLNLDVESANLIAKAGVLLSCGLGTITVNVENVNMTGSFTQAAQGCGAFIGQTNNVSCVFNFTNCSLYGNFDFTNAAQQAGGYIGHSRGTVTFTNCLLDGEFKIAGHRSKGGYVGLSNNAGKPINFVNCKATGYYLELEEGSAESFAAFVGQTAGTNTELRYTDCTCDAVMIGVKNNAAFFGSVKANSAKVYFDGCSMNGVIISNGSAGAFLGLTNNATITYTGADYSANSASGVVYAGTLVTAKEITGVTSTNLTESTEATDQQKTAALEAAGVTKTTKGNYYYSKDKSIVGLQTLAAETKAYYQTKDAGENKKDVRILISVPEAGVASVKGIDIEVTFGLTAGGVKTLTVNDKDEKLASYYSVIADSKIAEAGEGYVLLQLL